MKTEVYTGIGFNFVVHDLWATESQGPIQNRGAEHLGTMDGVLVVERKLMLRAIMDLEEGREPANVVRGNALNEFRIIAYNGVFPSSKPWKEAARDLEAAVRMPSRIAG